MSQPTSNDGGKFNSSVDIEAKGDLVIESDGAAVLAGLLQPKLDSQSTSVKINATNVSISSNKDVAVEIYDTDHQWNPDSPRAGDAAIRIDAVKKLDLSGE